MPTFRQNPYGAFNFIVSLGGTQGDGSHRRPASWFPSRRPGRSREAPGNRRPRGMVIHRFGEDRTRLTGRLAIFSFENKWLSLPGRRLSRAEETQDQAGKSQKSSLCIIWNHPQAIRNIPRTFPLTANPTLVLIFGFE